jgi:hypothetical protein
MFHLVKTQSTPHQSVCILVTGILHVPVLTVQDQLPVVYYFVAVQLVVLIVHHHLTVNYLYNVVLFWSSSNLRIIPGYLVLLWS